MTGTAKETSMSRVDDDRIKAQNGDREAALRNANTLTCRWIRTLDENSRLSLMKLLFLMKDGVHNSVHNALKDTCWAVIEDLSKHPAVPYAGQQGYDPLAVEFLDFLMDLYRDCLGEKNEKTERV